MRLSPALLSFFPSWCTPLPVRRASAFVTSCAEPRQKARLICPSIHKSSDQAREAFMSTSNISHLHLSNRNKRQRIEKQSSSKMKPDHKSNSLELSPYEQRMGVIITACPKCHGEGKVRAKLSKKAKARRKQAQSSSYISGNSTVTDDFRSNELDSPQNTSHHHNHQAGIPKKPCKECRGTGLIQRDLLNEQNLNRTPNHPDFTVAIVGGGIGGMALAAALQHRNIRCVVYERDLSFEERNQGYGLTMQQGARALRCLGFFSSVYDNTSNDQESCDSDKEEIKFGIQSTRHAVHTPDGNVIGEWGLRVWGGRFEKNGRSHATRQNAHISRQNLRKLLMEMLLPNTIRWGYKFLGYNSSVDASPTQPLQLKFLRRINSCNGKESSLEEEVAASVLVGCDGIRSAVRATKLGEDLAPLRYLDCVVILGIAPSPEASALTDGQTVFQTADGITRLYVMPFAEAGEKVCGLQTTCERGLSMWQLSFPMDETNAIELSQLGPSPLKVEAVRRCGSWHDPIPMLLNSTPETLITGYPCYDRSLVDAKDLRGGYDSSEYSNAYVTLLGDAAHPMSPFKGQGANQALLDAVLLAQKLHSALRKNDETQSELRNTVPDALAKFEREMLERCAAKVKKSADAAKFLHSEVAIAKGNVTRGAAAVQFGEVP
eukprot:CCRYP_001172-RA/>CCRYP_001172-RA protein AED:0.14 eAED:0.14 QI:426/-1/1/1/-1/1/1/165/659